MTRNCIHCEIHVDSQTEMCVWLYSVVRHDLGIHDMLNNCASYTCERYRSIVGGVMIVSFLEDSNHICRQPIIMDTASVNVLLE